MAISVCYWSLTKIYCGMVGFLRFPWENNFLCLFGYIWVERHFPLISPFANFNEILIHNLCRKQRIINVTKVMYHLQIILLKILSYQEDHLYIPRRAKAQVLSPVELLPGLVTNLRTDHRELLPGTYHWGNFEKVCANCLKLQVSSSYSNPSCQTLSKAFEISKKLALTSSEGLWSKSA